MAAPGPGPLAPSPPAPDDGRGHRSPQCKLKGRNNTRPLFFVHLELTIS
jgi:hypothetical protein